MTATPLAVLFADARDFILTNNDGKMALALLHVEDSVVDSIGHRSIVIAELAGLFSEETAKVVRDLLDLTDTQRTATAVHEHAASGMEIARLVFEFFSLLERETNTAQEAEEAAAQQVVAS